MSTHEHDHQHEHEHGHDHGHEPEPFTGTTEEFWEAHYGKKAQVWSGRVNPVMAAEVAGLTPGRALDLGSGEGGDAIWLAHQGWTVTAADVSPTALERLTDRAAAEGLADRIVPVRVDLTETFPAGEFDLVSAQFLQSPIELPRGQVLRQAMAAIAPGGVLLSVSHAAFPPWSQHHGEHIHFPTPEEELAELDVPADGWTVARCEVVEREGMGPEGQAGTLFDAVLLLRRAG